MLLTVVNSRLESLKGGLVNPLQPLVFVLWNACTGHQKPACGKLCLGITAISRQLVPLSIPVNRGSGVSQRGKHSMNRLGVALVSLDLRSRHLTLGRVDEYITLLSLNRCLLTIAVCLVPFLEHSLCKLNDGTHLTPYRQRNDDAISYFVNSRSQTIFKLCSSPIFYP